MGVLVGGVVGWQWCQAMWRRGYIAGVLSKKVGDGCEISDAREQRWRDGVGVGREGKGWRVTVMVRVGRCKKFEETRV